MFWNCTQKCCCPTAKTKAKLHFVRAQTHTHTLDGWLAWHTNKNNNPLLFYCVWGLSGLQYPKHIAIRCWFYNENSSAVEKAWMNFGLPRNIPTERHTVRTKKHTVRALRSPCNVSAAWFMGQWWARTYECKLFEMLGRFRSALCIFVSIQLFVASCLNIRWFFFFTMLRLKMWSLFAIIVHNFYSFTFITGWVFVCLFGFIRFCFYFYPYFAASIARPLARYPSCLFVREAARSW